MFPPKDISLIDRCPHPPCPTPFNMAAHVLAEAGKKAEKVALSIISPSKSERWSYGRLEAAVRGTATGLLESGFVCGDRVLLRLGNTPDFPIAYLACITVGILPVPTSAQLTEGEVKKFADVIDPAGALHDPSLPCPPDLFRVDVETLRSFREKPPADYEMGDPNRPAYIVFTSGTSGTPRAVTHAHRAIWARRMMHEGWYGLTTDDRLLHAGGFNWTFTLGTGLMDPWSVGATALIPAPGTEPRSLPLLLKRHQASIFASAPGVYRQILKQHKTLDLPDLRHGLAAGEKLSESLRETFRRIAGLEIYEAYGMSECSTFLSSSPSTPAAPHCFGTAQPGRRIALLQDGVAVPLGQEGEIAISRDDPGLMLGYHAAPEATRARFTNEWFLTGDIGLMHTDGQIEYLGRGDDMINAGGFRVSPAEVEAVIAKVPGVDAVAVTEVEIKADTRVIAAFYTSAELIPNDVFETAAQAALARYKQPRLYKHLDALPTGPNGKLSRRTLRDSFVPDITPKA